MVIEFDYQRRDLFPVFLRPCELTGSLSLSLSWHSGVKCCDLAPHTQHITGSGFGFLSVKRDVHHSINAPRYSINLCRGVARGVHDCFAFKHQLCV